MPDPQLPLPGLRLPDLSAWAGLINFAPPQRVTERLQALAPPGGSDPRLGLMQPGQAARIVGLDQAFPAAPINLDFFPVIIRQLPTVNGHQMSPAELLRVIRLNINDLVDPGLASFSPVPGDEDLWLARDPVGSVVTIAIGTLGDSRPFWIPKWTSTDNASVVTAESNDDHWIFSTLETARDWGHPVSGNRMFGYYPASDGTTVFYTRGADRTTSRIDTVARNAAFAGGFNLWTSFQKRLTEYVNRNNGHAEVAHVTASQYDWNAVRAIYFHPPQPRVTASNVATSPARNRLALRGYSPRRSMRRLAAAQSTAITSPGQAIEGIGGRASLRATFDAGSAQQAVRRADRYQDEAQQANVAFTAERQRMLRLRGQRTRRAGRPSMRAAAWVQQQAAQQGQLQAQLLAAQQAQQQAQLQAAHQAQVQAQLQARLNAVRQAQFQTSQSLLSRLRSPIAPRPQPGSWTLSPPPFQPVGQPGPNPLPPLPGPSIPMPQPPPGFTWGPPAPGSGSSPFGTWQPALPPAVPPPPLPGPSIPMPQPPPGFTWGPPAPGSGSSPFGIWQPALPPAVPPPPAQSPPVAPPPPPAPPPMF